MREVTIELYDSYHDIIEEELEDSRLSVEEWLGKQSMNAVEQLEAQRLSAKQQARAEGAAGVPDEVIDLAVESVVEEVGD